LGNRNRHGRPRPNLQRPRVHGERQVLVLGLGRFGSSVASEAIRLGFEVLGVDTDARRVQEHADLLTHAVEADTTDAEVLRQLGAEDFANAVVAIGTDVEASILTTANLDDIGVPDIWAKAVTQPHGRILSRVGAHHVVYPEHDMGQRLAHLVGGHMLEWIQLDEDFAMVETLAPAELFGTSLRDSEVRVRYGVTIVCVKPAGEGFTYATPDTTLTEGDVVVVAGPTKSAERFADLS
jgi:trk system potassium uptake protein TrkA